MAARLRLLLSAERSWRAQAASAALLAAAGAPGCKGPGTPKPPELQRPVAGVVVAEQSLAVEVGQRVSVELDALRAATPGKRHHHLCPTA